MNTEVARHLKVFIEQYGKGIYVEPQSCRAHLMDRCGTYKKEIHVLIGALENGIPGELISTRNIPYETLKSRLTNKLCDELVLTEQIAGWGIDTWAYALGIKEGLANSSDSVIEEGIFLFKKGNNGEACVFRPHPDTDSGNIRTAFRNYPDSITAYPDTLSND